MSDPGASAGTPTLGLSPVGEGIASRLEARAWSAPAQRGAADVSLDPVARATERLRDDSDLPGASSGRAGMLARLLDQSAVGLPTWDLWGDRHGAPVLRMLGASYVLSPDGWVWVRHEDDAPAPLPTPHVATRAPRRARGRSPVAGTVQPSPTRRTPPPTVVARPSAPELAPVDPAPVDEAPVEAVAAPPDVTTPVVAPALAAPTRRRGRRPVAAGVRARVGPRVLASRLARSAAFARRLAPPAPVTLAAGDDPVDAPLAPTLPRLRARTDLPEPTLLRAAEASPPGAAPSTGATSRTPARPASPSRRRAPTVRAPGAAIVRRAAARQRGLPLPPAPRTTPTAAVDRLVARRERPLGVAEVERPFVLPAPALATLAASTVVDAPGVSADPASPVRRRVGASPAAPVEGTRVSSRMPSPSPWARALARVDAVVPPAERHRPSAGVSELSPAVRLGARGEAAVSTAETLAPPPLSWVVPPAQVDADLPADTVGAPGRRPRRAAAHAEARAASAAASPPVAGPRPSEPDAAADETPDAFRAAVRARHRALGPVWTASRRPRVPRAGAPDEVWLTPSARADAPVVEDGTDAPATSTPAASFVTARSRGASAPRLRASARSVGRAELAPEPVVEAEAARELAGLGAPELQLLVAAGATGGGAEASDSAATLPSVSPSLASALAAAASSARPTRLHAPLAVWRRVLARAPQQALSALASDPASAARVVEAMRKMRTLPEDAATPLRAAVRAPTQAPAEVQRVRRDKTRTALSTLRGGARTRAGAAGSTRVTRLAQKLEGLVHLVESERRQAEAQRYVRRASEPAAAPSAVGPSRPGGDVSLESLQREVLEAVLRELERRRDRGQGVGDAIDG